jgi:acyl-CoA reductase-like NAD-dependent aldehyde dehydrogenase
MSAVAPDAPSKVVDEQSRTVIISTNPATGEVIGQVNASTPADVQAVIQRARTAQSAWHELGLQQRLKIMRKLKHIMRRELNLLTETLTDEQGRPRFEALQEIFATIELLAHSIRIAPQTLAPERILVPLLPQRIHWTEHYPYGVVAVIAPWNFPILLSLSPIVSALITGNTVIYKPSEFATQLGQCLTRFIHEAGVPDDVFQVVYGAGEIGAALIEAKPDKIMFTGSPTTGRKIAVVAGELLIPITLELGGKDAAIVLEDADLDRTAVALTWGGLFNAGQACLSIERIYVRREIADQLVEKIAAKMNDHVRTGDDDIRTMGPITTDSQIRSIDRHIKEAVINGARIVVGGRSIEDSNGRFYLPTLMTDVTPEMSIVREETFGPVIVVIPVDSDEEAIKQANNTAFGLTGSVWTRNRTRGIALLQKMRVGHASLNDHIMSATIPYLPWGGVGDSGYGRTRGREGLLDMTYTQAFSAERFAPLPREFFWYPYTEFKTRLLYSFLRFLYAPTLRERIQSLFSKNP